MTHEDITKKNHLMKSIMSNPKLARTFKDAMSSPIGSTKREHAKSILSIMKKVGGVRMDGMGGPMDMSSPMTTNLQPQPSTPETPDYSNLMIFPAAPAFKKKVVATPPTPTPISKTNIASTIHNDWEGIKNNGKGGPYDGQGGIFDNISSSLGLPASSSTSSSYVPSYSTPSTPHQSFADFTGLSSLGKLFGGTTTPIPQLQSKTNDYSNFNIKDVGNNLVNIIKGKPTTNLTGAPYSTPTTPSTTFPTGSTAIPPYLAAPKTTTATTPTPTNVPTGTPTPIPTPTPTSGGTPTPTPTPTPTTTGGTPTPTPTPTSTTTGAGTLSDADIKNMASEALKEATGPGLFALNVANKEFGGGLGQYIDNLDTKLKTSFNLDALETQLSNLKSEKGNLIPTLVDYVQGKDQYSKAINTMITTAQSEVLHGDMMDPVVNQRYNDYMNYLTTLKGRQDGRYQNYLNSAIADYSADVDKVQANYDNIHNQYTDALTRGSTIASDEYNKLYTAMGDYYNSLEAAPTKALNLAVLQQQYQQNAASLLQNSLGGSATNPKYWSDLADFSKNITIQDKTAAGAATDGTLDMSKIPPNGLIDLYIQNAHAGSDQAAMTEAIRQGLVNTLEKSGGDATTMARVKGLITGLANSGYTEAQTWADTLSNGIGSSTSSAYSSFITKNLGAVKSATKDLVGSYGGFLGIGKKASGITNKAQWEKDHSALGTEFLDSLYNTVNTAVQPGSAFASDPSSLINQLFAGDDATVAKRLANTIVQTS